MRALSIRQPWAWAILHAGKDIENRVWQPRNSALRFRGRVLLHASKGCTRKEFDEACEYMYVLVGASPIGELAELPRGAIVGAMTIADVVTQSDSKWFEGPVGLVLKDVVALPEPIPCKGALGYFRVPDDVASRIRAQTGRAA